MRKLTEININTPEYWDRVFEKEIQLSRERIALDRFRQVSALIPSNCSVFDAGCGGGDFVRYLEKNRPDLKISACDFSKIAIDYASEKSPNINFKVVDVLKLTKTYKKEFDFVICFETIEHVDDPQLLVDELIGITNKNGTIVITTPFDDKVCGAGEHMYAFKYDDFVNMFNMKDCQITELRRYSENYKNLLCVAKKI